MEPQIEQALASIFDVRVFPDTAPQGVAKPFVIYQQIGGRPSNAICGNTKQQNARVQVVVWSKRRVEANALMRQAEAALIAALNAVSLGSLTAIYDEAGRLYGARQDFSIWTSS